MSVFSVSTIETWAVRVSYTVEAEDEAEAVRQVRDGEVGYNVWSMSRLFLI